MKQKVQWVFTALLMFFLVCTFYAIFNVGNPRSLFRPVIRDTSYDTLITIILAVLTALTAMVLYAGRMQNESPIAHLLDINEGYIQELRDEGKSDADIAESFLKEIGSKKGIVHRIARRKVLRYLSRM